MTEKEKARAYDKAIEKIKYVMEHGVQPVLNKEDLQSIFPGIFESEDERIRKSLIEYFGEQCDMSDWNGVYGYQVLAWLEKQGQQKCIPKYKIGDYVKNTNYKGEPIYEIIYMDKECYICEYRGKERMGDKAVMHFSFDNPYLRLVQKSDDKVESKFHEGDWIVNNDSGDVFQVTEIRDDEYYLCPLDDEIMGYLRIIAVDTDYHLWTIHDAKDGDVLSSGHLVFIFKVIHGVWLNCHCSAHNDGSFIADSYDLMTNKYFSEVHPATKEQRDFLFAKMKEAGYEWDGNKKELRKIEQKSKWSNEDEKRLQSCIIALQGKGLMGGVDTIDTKWLKSLKQRIGE